jgi:hypothetical protein
MSQSDKKIKIPLNGTVDRKHQVTGSGEQQYYAHRRAAVENKAFTKQSFEEALRQSSRHVSEPASKDSGKSK